MRARWQVSVTLLLTIVAADTFVEGVVPVCHPVLWIEWFFLLCWFFNVLTILANIFSHFLYYKALPEVYASGMPRISNLATVPISALTWLLTRRRTVDNSNSPPTMMMWRSSSSIHPSALTHGVPSPCRSGVPSASVTSSARGVAWREAGGGRETVAPSICSVDSIPRAGAGSVVGDGAPHSLRRHSTTPSLTHVISNPHLEPNSPGRARTQRRLRMVRHATRLGHHRPHGALVSVVCTSPNEKNAVSSTAPPTQSQYRLDGLVEETAEIGAPARSNDDSAPVRIVGLGVPPPVSVAPPRLTQPLVSVAPPPLTQPPSGTVTEDSTQEKTTNNDGVESLPPALPSAPPQTPPVVRALRSFRRIVQGSVIRPSCSVASSSSAPSTARSNRDSVASSRIGKRTSLIMPDFLAGAMAGAFTETDELAAQVTATELDPVNAALVRKAFRLLDSMSSMVGEIGPQQVPPLTASHNTLPPLTASHTLDRLSRLSTASHTLDHLSHSLPLPLTPPYRPYNPPFSHPLPALHLQMEYFAHHFGRLPKELRDTDTNHDGYWSIEEFSHLCVRLIGIYGDVKFRMLVEGLLESYEHRIKLHHVYWHGWALWLDYVSLVLLPVAYTICLFAISSWMGEMNTPDPVMHMSGVGSM